MKFKSVNFKPELVTGWCYNEEDPATPATIHLMVDQDCAQVISCIKPRMELDRSLFPNRYIGFVSFVPHRYWDGQDHTLALVDPRSGTVLREQALTFPDARLPGHGDVFAQLLSDHPARISGWVSDGVAPAMVQLEIDGAPIASSVADVEEMRAHPWGYNFVVPARFFDDTGHSLRLTAQTAGGDVELLHVEKVIARADLPSVVCALTTTEPGVLAGTALSGSHPDRPLSLSLLINDVPVLTTVCDADDDGAFSFDLATLSQVDPSRDIVDIVAEPYGLVLDCLDADVLRTTATWTLVPTPDGGADIHLTTITPIRLVGDAILKDDAGRHVSLEFEPSPVSPYTAIARLNVVDRYDTSLSLLLADMAITRTLSDQPPGPQSGATQGVGRRENPVLFNAGDTHVRDVLRALQLNAEPIAGDSLAFSGGWTIDNNGRVRGWAINLADPKASVKGSLTINDVKVGIFKTGLPIMVPEAPLAIPLLLGFEIDATRFINTHGRHKIGIVLPGGLEVVGLKPGFIRYPLRPSPAPFELGRALGLSSPPQPAAEVVDKLLGFIDAEQWTRLHYIFGVDAPPPGDRQRPNVAHTVYNLLRDAVLNHGIVQQLLNPSSPLPHHRTMPPLAGVDMTAVLAALPLHPETLDALAAARTWRAFLIAFLADPELFGYLCNPSDTGDALILDQLDLLRSGMPRDVTLSRSRIAQALPDSLAGLTSLVALDPQGAVVLNQSVRNDDHVRNILSRLVSTANPAAYPGTWFLAVSRSHGDSEHWAVLPITWEADPDIVPRNSSLVLRTLRISGRMAQIVLDTANPGTALPTQVGLWLDRKYALLAHIAEPADVEISELPTKGARYVGIVDAPSCTHLTLDNGISDPAGTYDVRLGDQNGPRPAGLPAIAEADPAGELSFGDIVFCAGDIRGWVLSTAAEGKSVRMTLVEDLPPPDDGADPDTLVEVDPASLIVQHGRALTKAPVASVQALYGQAFANCGFGVQLAPALLDGMPHPLRLLTEWGGGKAQDIWSGTFVATEDFLAEQIGTCETPDELKNLLMSAATAGRVDIIDRYFESPSRLARVDLEVPVIFEILAALTLRDVDGLRSAKLRRLYDSLWTHALTSTKRQNEFYAIALRVVMETEPADTRQRFPHSPLTELAMDLVFLLQRAKVGADVIARDAYNARRLPLARQIVADAGGDASASLLATGAQIQMALGQYAVSETLIRQALEKRPGSADALMVLARNLVRQGKPLDAVATITQGRGLSQWLTEPPSYDVAKIFVALDWVGALMAAAAASGREKLIADVERSFATQGPPERLADTGFSLVLMKPGKADMHPLFTQLAPCGCLQVTSGDTQRMSELDCMGGWIVVLEEDNALSPELLNAIFAQRRPYEPVVQMVQSVSMPGETPYVFKTAGAMIRADALRAFGPVPFDEFMTQAQAVLRVKTVLI